MNSFIRNTLIIYSVSFVFIFLLKYFDVVSSIFYLSAIYAGVINLVNTFIAALLFKLSYKSDHSSFMIFNFGGLGVRIIFLLISFILVIKFLNIDKYGFIFIFFIFYFISLALEVIFYSHSSKQNK